MKDSTVFGSYCFNKDFSFVSIFQVVFLIMFRVKWIIIENMVMVNGNVMMAMMKMMIIAIK